MEAQWSYSEKDLKGVYHSRRRIVNCPRCGNQATETECFDVGGRWLICRQCGLMED